MTSVVLVTFEIYPIVSLVALLGTKMHVTMQSSAQNM